MDQPLVSVIMPAYNAEKYIAEAIESVINQSYTNWELIIIDDGSTDNTANEINKYTDKRIIFIKESNAGQSTQLNLGITIANGQYIAIAHADDINLVNRLSLQVAFLKENNNIDVCGSYIRTFNEKTSEGRIIEFPTESDFCYSMLYYGNPLAHPAVMFKKSIFELYNLSYNKEQKAAEDYNLWIRLSKHCKISNIPKELVLYRLHNQQTSVIQKLEEEKIVQESRLLLIMQLTSNRHKHKHLELLNFFYHPKELSAFAQWKSFFLALKLIVSNKYMSVNNAKYFLAPIFEKNLKFIPYNHRLKHILFTPLLLSNLGLKHFLSISSNLFFKRS